MSENFDYYEDGNTEYLDDGGASAYVGQEGNNTGYVNESFTNGGGETTYLASRNKYSSIHSRPSDKEIEESKLQQRRHLGGHKDSTRQNSTNQLDIEESKKKQMAYLEKEQKENKEKEQGQKENKEEEDKKDNGSDEGRKDHVTNKSSHARPSDAALMTHENSGQLLGVDRDTNVMNDRDYILKYFPGANDVYVYDDDGNILSAADVSLAERKLIKRAVSGHWYFMTYGFVTSEPKAKSLSDKLAKIKPGLTLPNHLMRNIESKWLKSDNMQ